MTDIARLGFSADTSDLDETKAKLDALVPAAQRVTSAGVKVEATFKGIGGAAAQAASGLTSSSNAFQRASTGAAAASTTAERGASWFDRLAAAVGRVVTQLRGVPAAANNSATALSRMGRAANDNINALQSTPGNVAAQFQDIGVTAAAGMNPMIIALQQGTQLSAAMAGGLGNLARGLAQVFSATTLLTIGLVGLIAAGIQMVDWVEVAQTVLNGLADVMVDIAPYAVGIAAAMALIYAPAIVTGIWSLATAFYGLAAGMLATLGIPALIVLGLAGIIAAANYWRDELTQMLGFDIVQAAKTGVNFILAFFIGGFNAIMATWSQLPNAIGDVVIQASNFVLKTLESMINRSIALINSFTSMLPMGLGQDMQMGGVSIGIANPFAGSARGVAEEWGRQTQGALGVDHLGNIVGGIKGMASDAADWLRNLASGLGAEAGDKDKDKAGRTRTPRREKTNEEKWADLLKDADKQLRSLQDLNAQVGIYGEDLMRLRHEQQLFNAAQDKGIKLTDEMTEELKRRAAEMASLEQSTAHDVLVESIRRDHADTMEALRRERGEIGLSGAALEAYRIETELLAKARKANIDLNDAELAALGKIAREQATAAEAIRKTKEALDEARGTARGFFEDWYDGIMSGRNIFSAFADAVINGLTRIAEKMMDRAIDKFLDMMFQGTNNSNSPFGGGLLGNVLGAVFGAATGTAGVGKSPGMTGTGAPKGFAKGGIVSDPTLFSFANGSMGQMGEAGEEAIMPLKRGPDGSLGVQGTVGGNTTVNDVKVNNNYNVSGAVTPSDIMRAIRAGSEQTQREVKRQLMGWLQEIQVDGGTV